MDLENPIQKVREFNRFYTNIISILDKSVLDSGYSLAEARVLYEIGKSQPCTARTLKNTITIDEGYLSRILHDFCNRELVIRRQSEYDKRKYELCLSENGEKQLHFLHKTADHSTKKLIEKLTAPELSKLLKSMQAITHILN